MTTIEITDPRLLIEVAGRNARIAGEPAAANPYQSMWSHWWFIGWRDADEDIRISNRAMGG